MPMIPSGDNLGNVLPRSGRTNIQGGNGVLGRAMIGLGRDVQRAALHLEHEKEQANQVEMRNAVLEREKQVNTLKNSIDERVRLGELDPESAVTEYTKQLNALPKQQPEGLTGRQQETLNYYYNATAYRAEQQVFSIYRNGIVVKAQTAVSEAVRLINEDPNADIDSSLAIFDSEAMQSSIRTGWGMKAPEMTASLKRDVLLSNLQNKSTIASDNSNYKYLSQFRADVMKPDFYKGILQNDDRVKLAHNASIGLDRIDSKMKAAQTQAKLAAKEQYDNLTDSLYWQMSKEGKLFNELDQEQLALLRPKDYEYFKNYKTVKQDEFAILEDAIYKINNQQDIDLNSPYIRKNLTSSTIEGLAKKKANLMADPKLQQDFFKSNELFRTQAKVNKIKPDSEDYMKLQNNINETIRERAKVKGAPLNEDEKLQIINDQFVRVTVKGGGWFGTNSNEQYYQVEDKSKVFIENVDSIPKQTKDALLNKFKARGIDPTDEQMTSAYNAYLQGN